MVNGKQLSAMVGVAKCFYFFRLTFWASAPAYGVGEKKQRFASKTAGNPYSTHPSRSRSIRVFAVNSLGRNDSLYAL